MELVLDVDVGWVTRAVVVVLAVVSDFGGSGVATVVEEVFDGAVESGRGISAGCDVFVGGVVVVESSTAVVGFALVGLVVVVVVVVEVSGVGEAEAWVPDGGIVGCAVIWSV